MFPAYIWSLGAGCVGAVHREELWHDHHHLAIWLLSGKLPEQAVKAAEAGQQLDVQSCCVLHWHSCHMCQLCWQLWQQQGSSVAQALTRCPCRVASPSTSYWLQSQSTWTLHDFLLQWSRKELTSPQFSSRREKMEMFHTVLFLNRSRNILLTEEEHNWHFPESADESAQHSSSWAVQGR